MKRFIIGLFIFCIGCGIVPEDERYVTDKSINESDNTTAAIERYMSFRGR